MEPLVGRAKKHRLDRAAYRAQQLCLLLQSAAIWRVAHALARTDPPALSPEVTRQLRSRLRALFDRDLANVEQGHYPAALLFQVPLARYARRLPGLIRDAPRVLRRMQGKNYQDLPPGLDIRQYPPYYRRTFHWQTDGYLSHHSASLYDIGVEILFYGTADVMRRQIIPPISQHLRGRDPTSLRLLDVACGTGRTLGQLAITHPDLRYHGVDLSPFYLHAARQTLCHVRDLSLLRENAETLPYRADYFDIVTSVFLFHELPRSARRRVLTEAHRVLRPGGLLVVADSVQPSDSHELLPFIQSFPRWFHEPFYECYLRDDLAALMTECGFDVKSAETHYVAKAVIARKLAR